VEVATDLPVLVAVVHDEQFAAGLGFLWRHVAPRDWPGFPPPDTCLGAGTGDVHPCLSTRVPRDYAARCGRLQGNVGERQAE
jgi:hypothetical protein